MALSIATNRNGNMTLRLIVNAKTRQFWPVVWACEKECK